jgi:hypothetical protein
VGCPFDFHGKVVVMRATMSYRDDFRPLDNSRVAVLCPRRLLPTECKHQAVNHAIIDGLATLALISEYSSAEEEERFTLLRDEQSTAVGHIPTQQSHHFSTFQTEEWTVSQPHS